MTIRATTCLTLVMLLIWHSIMPCCSSGCFIVGSVASGQDSDTPKYINSCCGSQCTELQRVRTKENTPKGKCPFCGQCTKQRLPYTTSLPTIEVSPHSSFSRATTPQNSVRITLLPLFVNWHIPDVFLPDAGLLLLI